MANNKKRATSTWLSRAFLSWGEASAHQLFDLGPFALWFVPGIVVPAMNALFTETGATPEQVVHGALQFLHSIRQIGRRRRACWVCHAGKVVPAEW